MTQIPQKMTQNHPQGLVFVMNSCQRVRWHQLSPGDTLELEHLATVAGLKSRSLLVRTMELTLQPATLRDEDNEVLGNPDDPRVALLRYTWDSICPLQGEGTPPP